MGLSVKAFGRQGNYILGVRIWQATYPGEWYKVKAFARTHGIGIGHVKTWVSFFTVCGLMTIKYPDEPMGLGTQFQRV